jgi:hypothetical protein
VAVGFEHNTSMAGGKRAAKDGGGDGQSARAPSPPSTLLDIWVIMAAKQLLPIEGWSPNTEMHATVSPSVGLRMMDNTPTLAQVAGLLATKRLQRLCLGPDVKTAGVELMSRVRHSRQWAALHHLALDRAHLTPLALPLPLGLKHLRLEHMGSTDTAALAGVDNLPPHLLTLHISVNTEAQRPFPRWRLPDTLGKLRVENMRFAMDELRLPASVCQLMVRRCSWEPDFRVAQADGDGNGNVAALKLVVQSSVESPLFTLPATVIEMNKSGKITTLLKDGEQLPPRLVVLDLEDADNHNQPVGTLPPTLQVLTALLLSNVALLAVNVTCPVLSASQIAIARVSHMCARVQVLKLGDLFDQPLWHICGVRAHDNVLMKCNDDRCTHAQCVLWLVCRDQHQPAVSKIRHHD